MLRALGHFAEASEAYHKALKRRPNLPNCLSGLGLLSVRSGDFKAAARHFEAALALVPEADGEARASLWANLGSARLDAGFIVEGIDALTQAVRHAPHTAHYWRLLASNLLHISVVPGTAQFREVLLALFRRDDINPNMLATAAVEALLSNPRLMAIVSAIAETPARTDDIIESQISVINNLLREPLLLALLVNAPIPHPELEMLLTGLRRRILMSAWRETGMAGCGPELSSICALARQCFLNEYVYFVSREEEAALAALCSKLGREDFGAAAHDWTTLGAIGCFVPLHETKAAQLNFHYCAGAGTGAGGSADRATPPGTIAPGEHPAAEVGAG